MSAAAIMATGPTNHSIPSYQRSNNHNNNNPLPQPTKTTVNPSSSSVYRPRAARPSSAAPTYNVKHYKNLKNNNKTITVTRHNKNLKKSTRRHHYHRGGPARKVDLGEGSENRGEMKAWQTQKFIIDETLIRPKVDLKVNIYIYIYIYIDRERNIDVYTLMCDMWYVMCV